MSPIEKDGDAGELLYANFHPKPGQAAAPPPKPGAAFASIGPLPTTPPKIAARVLRVCTPPEKTEINNKAAEIDKMSEISMAAATNAKTSAESTKSEFDKLYESISASNKDLAKLTKLYREVLPPELITDEKEIAKKIETIKKIGGVIAKNVEDTLKFADRVKEYIAAARGFAKNAQDYAESDCVTALNELTMADKSLQQFKSDATDANTNAVAAAENYNKVVSPANDMNSLVSKLKTINPPNASVGQNVQFIVNYGGNVTPTWTFVRFKGAPLFGAQGMRTHILNISLGPSAAATPGAPLGASTVAPSLAVTQSQLNLLLTTLLPARSF